MKNEGKISRLINPIAVGVLEFSHMSRVTNVFRNVIPTILTIR